MTTCNSNCKNEDSPSDNARREAVDFLFGRIDYERALAVPYRKREFKLDRMRSLLALLDNPERGLSIVHVAGTKGKGSTAAMLSSVLVAAGYRVGLFTSPHLHRVEERMAIDGQPCTGDELVELVELIRPAVAEMDRVAALSNEQSSNAGDDDYDSGPTYFEITTAMGLLLFARRGVDMAILEVGLGGRLDSTNVCQPLVAAITSISFDHTRQLGNSLASIAREKAGIVKTGVPVVSGVVTAESRDVIRAVCRERNAPLIEVGRDFSYQYIPSSGAQERGMDYKSKTAAYRALRLGLIGRHQAANAAVALAIIDQLRKQNWCICEEAVRHGLANARCRGRVEIVRQRPLTVIDTAHNPASIEALLDALDEYPISGRRILLFAATEEKDIERMLTALSKRFDRAIFTKYQENPRGVDPRKLADIWEGICAAPCFVEPLPQNAWQQASREATPDDLICVTGSFYIVSELYEIAAKGPA